MTGIQELTAYFFGGLSIFLAASNVQTNNVSKKRKLAIFIYVFTIEVIFYPLIGQVASLIAVVGIILLLCWHLPFKACNLLCFLIGYLTVIWLDYTLENLANILFHISFQQLQQTYLLIFSLILSLLLFIMTSLLRYLLHTKLHLQTLRLSKPLLIGTVSNLTLCLLIFLSGIINGQKLGYPSEVIKLNGILFSLYFIVSNVILILIYRAALHEREMSMQLQQYENLSTYTQEVERLYSDMRSFKHDYLDILLSLKEHIDTGKTEELEDFFYAEILPASQKMAESDNKLGVLANLKIAPLKSIVSAKLLSSMEKGIHVSIEITEPIDSVLMDTLDLVRVVGVFLNNAMEAAVESAEKSVLFAVIKDSSSTVFLIKNSCSSSSLPLAKICSSDFSTKGNFRGIGLHTARQILNSYKTIQWDMDYSAPWFTQTLIIR